MSVDFCVAFSFINIPVQVTLVQEVTQLYSKFNENTSPLYHSSCCLGLPRSPHWHLFRRSTSEMRNTIVDCKWVFPNSKRTC